MSEPLCSSGREVRVATSQASWARRLLALLAGPRLRAIWITAAAMFVLFALFRAAMMLAKADQLATVSAGEIARCFLLGARYDAMPVGYTMLPLVLLLTLAPASVLNRRRVHAAAVAYAAAVVTLVTVTEAIGAFFFQRFGQRLNYMAIAYLTHRETLLFIWNNYPAWATVPATAVGFYLFYRLFKRWFRGPAAAAWSVRRRIALGVLLGGLCVLACRGGVARQPLHRGSAYFSINQLVNQLTMNHFFTVFHAAKSELTDGKDERKIYHLPPVDQAAAVACGMFCQDEDLPLDHPANPLWRRSRSAHRRRRCNVVLIVMESMASEPVGALGYSPSYTPQLDALCQEGLFFERMYAVGARTSRAMVGSLFGHPDLGGTTIMKRPQAIGRFVSLPAILRDRGYRTMFIYGGRGEFDNMGEFFVAAGVEDIIDQNQMTGKVGNWGVPDEDIFQCAHERFLAMGDETFFATILTVSNHAPFEIPPGRIEMLPTEDNEQNKILNAYRYADWSLGEFFRQARSAAYFDNTIFVLVADHGIGLRQLHIVDVPRFRIPCLIYAPGIVPPGRVRTVASQTDIPPTILGLLGGEYEHCFFGRDVLRVPEGEGFALLHEDVHLAFVQDDLALALRPGSKHKPILYRVGPFDMEPLAPGEADPQKEASLKEKMLSYYKMARHLYVRGAFCAPQRYIAATSVPSLRGQENH